MKIGDVVEFDVPGGFVYLQLTHNHFSKGNGFWYGWFCRVLSGSFPKRPSMKRLQKLVLEPERFGCFFGNAKDFEVVANIPEFPGGGSFPVCKQYIGSRPSPTCVWVFWDGRVERVTYRMPTDAASLPNREIVDAAVIRKRIERNWSPSFDVPSECIELKADRFTFSEFPLLGDFEKDRSRYGDIYGFLASRGLMPIANEEAPITLAGIGPFENSVAEDWLMRWDSKGGWEGISTVLNHFIESPQRSTIDSAITVAAAGLILTCSGLLNCPNQLIIDTLMQCGPAPLNLIRTAMIAMTDVQLRSGLKDQWDRDPRGPKWLESTSKQQAQLIELRRRRMK